MVRKKSKKRGRHSRNRAARNPGLEFATLEIVPEKHESFREEIREEAQRRIARIPELLEILESHLKNTTPLGILASFAVYGLSEAVDTRRLRRKVPLEDIQQHHAELLQALASAIPFRDWGRNPVTPDVMQTVFDTVEELAETFIFQRILSGQEVADEEKWTVLAVLERIRFYTFGVRNWGYFSDVVKISTELYGSLDQSFCTEYSFAITELVQVMRCVIDEFERRTSEHFDTLARIMRGKTSRELIILYWEYVPDLVGSAEEFAEALPKGASRDSVASRLMAHLDLRLPECAIFRAQEIAKLTGYPVDKVSRILRAISKPPGEFAERKVEHVFLGNPIWAAPGIDLGDCFFFPIPQSVFSHIHSVVYRLCDEASLKEALETTRSIYLETKLGEGLAAALPGAKIRRNVKWRIGNQEFENDLLAVLDRTLVIAEAKSNRFTPEGARGAPGRLKRHVRDLVLAPSIQSKRLEDRVTEAQEGDEAAISTVRGLGIDPSSVDRVVRLSVTLDELPLLSSAELELKRIGWVPADHQLAPSMPISDLLCVIEILDNPILLLHYLIERSYFQKAFNALGIEPDFLGLYLETGLIGSKVGEQLDSLSILGMSQEIDRYFASLDSSRKLPKPKPKLSPLFRSSIAMLVQRRPAGWTTLGLHLLSCCRFGDQVALERDLAKLRKSVQRNYRNPQHKSVFHIPPLEKRRAHVVFYLYPRLLGIARKTTMQRLGHEALASSPTQECCVIAKCVDDWQVPYHAACVVRCRESGESGN